MDETTQPGNWRRDLACILLLMLLASGLRGLVIWRTSVTARDSLGFIRYAWRLEREPWDVVLQQSLHPPLYPLSVLAMSIPVRQVLPTTSPECLAMQMSAQLAAALAGVLLVIPMFYIGRDLFDRQVGFWSALLFQCMPVASRALSDGLTEGIYLLLAATFLVTGARALRSRSVLGFIACGLLSGLAYLTRPEGAALAIVLCLVLLALQLRPELRWPRQRLAECLVVLPISALVVAGPYMATIKNFSNKNSANWILESQPDGKPRAEAGPKIAGLLFADMGPMLAEWEPGWRAGGRHMCSLSWAISAFVKEVGKGFHYIVCIPVGLGLFWFRSRVRTNPISWIGSGLCILYALVLLRLAMVAGYMSERHSLLFVLCGAPWAVAGMRELPVRLSQMWPRLLAWGQRPSVQFLFIISLCLYGVPNSLRPLHPTRLGFRAAGFWIAAHAQPTDEILDPYVWTRYYAGRELSRLQPAVKDVGSLTYVVLDNIYSADHHSHLPALQRAEREAAGHAPVYHWPENVPASEALVFVYAVPWKPLPPR
jgi:hypothetical protein